MLISGICCLLLLPVVALTQPVWESLNGPCGGTVSSIAVDPDGDLYIVAGFKTLYRSENNGEQWEELGFPGSEPASIHILSDGTFLMQDVTGTWRSVNEGQTWSKVSGLEIYSLVENSEGTVFGITYNGVYKSTDQGLHWTASGLANHSLVELALDPEDGLWVAGAGGTPYRGVVYRSADDGATWELKLEGAPYSDAYNSVEALPSGAVLAFNWEKICRTTDQGLSWEAWTNPGIEKCWVLSDGALYGSVYGLGLFRSDNEGNTWEPEGLEGFYLNCLSEAPGGWLFVGVYNAGIARRSAVTPEWTFVNEGIIASSLYRIGMDAQGVLYGLMEPNFLYSWDPQTLDWSVQPLPEGYYFSYFFVEPGGLLILSDEYSLLISDDGGTTWDFVDHFGASSMVFDPAGVWYATGNGWTITGMQPGVFRSSDQGLSWENISPPLTDFWFANGIFLTQSNTLLVFTLDQVGPHTFRSVDGGESWTEILAFQNLIPPVFAEATDVLYAMGYHMQTYKTQIFSSSDDGATWTFIKELGFSASELAANASGHLFLNDGQNIRKSSTGGKTWKLYGISEFSGYEIPRMILSPDDVLYVSYPGHGVWRTATPTTPVTELPEALTLPLSLCPNPVWDQATVSFYLSEASLIRLEAFNAEGRAVGSLQEQYFSAGPHAIQVPTGDWPAGIYFLRLSGDAGMGMVSMVKE